MFWHILLNSFDQAWREAWRCSAVPQCRGTRGSRHNPAGSHTVGFPSTVQFTLLLSIGVHLLLTVCSPGLPGTWWTSVLLTWFVTDLHSLLAVCRRFFHLVTSLWTLLFGFGFSAEGFTSILVIRTTVNRLRAVIFLSALPWTQKMQCQDTEKVITLNPQNASSFHSLTFSS